MCRPKAVCASAGRVRALLLEAGKLLLLECLELILGEGRLSNDLRHEAKGLTQVLPSGLDGSRSLAHGSSHSPPRLHPVERILDLLARMTGRAAHEHLSGYGPRRGATRECLFIHRE